MRNLEGEKNSTNLKTRLYLHENKMNSKKRQQECTLCGTGQLSEGSGKICLNLKEGGTIAGS